MERPGAVLEILTAATLENNIIAYASGGTAIATSGNLTTNCNVFWANSDGAGVPLSPTDREVDPLFCDPAAGIYTLSQSSPCLPGSDPNCTELVGSLGGGCGVTSVEVTLEHATWGRIKGMYQSKER
jgi:hypothetical protein